jgi:hypothetical protein
MTYTTTNTNTNGDFNSTYSGLFNNNTNYELQK